MHVRGNSPNHKRQPGLRYFRGSRVNFRSDSEHRKFQRLSHYGRNNPQKSLELLTSLLLLFLFLSVLFYPFLLLFFSRRRASWSVTRDSTEILIHLRVKRISLHAIYIMHDYMPQILCMHRSSSVYHMCPLCKKKSGPNL